MLQDTRWIQHGDGVVLERSCWVGTRNSTMMHKWFLKFTHTMMFILINRAVSDFKKLVCDGKNMVGIVPIKLRTHTKITTHSRVGRDFQFLVTKCNEFFRW